MQGIQRSEPKFYDQFPGSLNVTGPEASHDQLAQNVVSEPGQGIVHSFRANLPPVSFALQGRCHFDQCQFRDDQSAVRIVKDGIDLV